MAQTTYHATNLYKILNLLIHDKSNWTDAKDHFIQLDESVDTQKRLIDAIFYDELSGAIIYLITDKKTEQIQQIFPISVSMDANLKIIYQILKQRKS